MSWGNLGVARIRDTARESQLGINRVIIRGLRIAVRTMGGCARAPTQICTARQRERERERERAHRYANARAHTRVRAEMHTHTAVVARTRALPRIRTMLSSAPSLTLLLDRGNLRGEPRERIRGGNGIFSIDAPRLNRRLYFSTPSCAAVCRRDSCRESWNRVFFGKFSWFFVWLKFCILIWFCVWWWNLVGLERFFCDIVTLERERLDVVVRMEKCFRYYTYRFYNFFSRIIFFFFFFISYQKEPHFR